MFGHDDDHDKKEENSGTVLGQPTVTPDPTPDGSLDHPEPPAANDSVGGLPFSPPPQEPAGPPPPPPVLNDDKPADNPTPATLPGNDDLVLIKQEALKQLSPLVGHLDQTPEEKFRTTMMMIQASDDEKLVAQAFEAAKQIKDDKERAQALLDVINEINYFTQQPEAES